MQREVPARKKLGGPNERQRVAVLAQQLREGLHEGFHRIAVHDVEAEHGAKGAEPGQKSKFSADEDAKKIRDLVIRKPSALCAW